MDIKPVRNESDYRVTLAEIYKLMMAKKSSAEGERLDVLVTLVEAYEAKNYPLDLPDAIEAITFEIERRNLTVKDLVPMIGEVIEFTKYSIESVR